MIRNLKALGLALVAMFALGAVVASGASAQTIGKITSESGKNSVTLDGVENGENYFEDTTLGSRVLCPGSTVTGHEFEKTPHTEIPNGSSTATITPEFVNCKTGAGTLVTVTMNGCDFSFTLGETTEAVEHSEYAVTAHIECPTQKTIEIHIYSSATNENIPICTYTIHSQTLKGDFDVKNEVEGSKTLDSLIVTGEAEDVEVERHGLCGNKTELYKTDQRINYTITGTHEGVAEGVTITH